MFKKAFYGRVSSEDQAERGTIKAQQDFAYKYADLHQLDILQLLLEYSGPAKPPVRS